MVWAAGVLLTWLMLWVMSGPRTYVMGASGALMCSVVLAPFLLLGFQALRKWLDTIDGVWMLIVSPCVAALTLGVVRFMGQWSTTLRGGLLDLAFAVLALHLVVWGGMFAVLRLQDASADD